MVTRVGEPTGSGRSAGPKKSARGTPSRGKSAKGKAGAKKAGMARSTALQVLLQVEDGVSLSALQTTRINPLDDSRDRALCQELAYGVLRWRWKLDVLIAALLKKALKKKDSDIQWVLRLALYELLECRSPDYAVINDAVLLVRQRRKNWATGLVNAVLRHFLREKESLLLQLDGDEVIYSHPPWLLEKIRADWPQHWRQLLQANNQRPPLWLRVNARQSSREDYAAELAQAGHETQPHPYVESALMLTQSTDVQGLPGFARGRVSVQDAGAQLAAWLLPVQPGQRVLDLCAAPGGKTCHLLERYPQIRQLLAVEKDPARMARVKENLVRLQLEAECRVMDARDIATPDNIGRFEAILIDAPCSASGVIRRHPDIKTLRREQDIAPLCDLQARILSAAWQVLAPGGQLLYVTCSVFHQENQQQITRFLEKTADASVNMPTVDWGVSCSVGRQLLPGEEHADGFYFCLLQKAAIQS